MQHAIRGSGVRLVKHRRRAIGTLQFNQFGGDVIECFIPADPLELSFTTLADAHHRIEQTLGGVEAAAIGTPAQTGTQLRLLDRILAIGTVLLIATVVCRQSHDDVTLLVCNQHMPRTAVMVAAGHNGRQLVIGVMRLVGKGIGFIAFAYQFDQASGSRNGSAGRDGLEKAATCRIEKILDPVRRCIIGFTCVHGYFARRLATGRKRASEWVGRERAQSGSSSGIPGHGLRA